MTKPPTDEVHLASALPALAPSLRLRPAFETKVISRKHLSWRSRFRAMISFDGVIVRCIRVVRFILMLGPWRNLAVAVLCRSFRNRTFPRIEPTMFPDVDVDAASSALAHDGFAVGLRLPRSSIKTIAEFGARSPLIEEAHWDCAEVNRIAHDSAIVEVVKRYLGVEPILFSTTLFWTLPNKSGNHTYAEKFHYDVGDLKSVCVCFYLTDVLLDSAPHVAIAGTHKRKSVRRLINPFITDEYAAQRFGSRVKTFLGEAGTGFFEDQATQHKRLLCTRPRLALFLNYTLRRQPDTVRVTAQVKASLL